MGYEVAIKNAKSRLSELGRMADAGERIIITKHGVPAYELKPVRRGGVDFEAIQRDIAENGPIIKYVAPDFDDPLPDSFWFGNDD
jgi:antitoxin (DNA-binding transcriptional repressor) of toxin-antitoxin stability system